MIGSSGVGTAKEQDAERDALAGKLGQCESGVLESFRRLDAAVESWLAPLAGTPSAGTANGWAVPKSSGASCSSALIQRSTA